MMKKYISITIVFITLAFMTGCDDVLEENPTGFISPEQFYNTEKDALIGVSMTGIGSGKILGYNMIEAAEIVKVENTRIAKSC